MSIIIKVLLWVTLVARILKNCYIPSGEDICGLDTPLFPNSLKPHKNNQSTTWISFNDCISAAFRIPVNEKNIFIQVADSLSRECKLQF